MAGFIFAGFDCSGGAVLTVVELLEEAGTGLAHELAADFFAGHSRAVVQQSAALRVLQSRGGAGEAAVYKRCAGASRVVMVSARPAASRLPECAAETHVRE